MPLHDSAVCDHFSADRFPVHRAAQFAVRVLGFAYTLPHVFVRWFYFPTRWFTTRLRTDTHGLACALWRTFYL